MLTDTSTAILIISIFISSISLVSDIAAAFYIHELRAERDKANALSLVALDSQTRTEERMTEVSKIHQELLSRPINVLVPPNFVETLGNALVQYLDAVNDEPTTIWPKDKKPS
jgi:hypothetical protein